MLLYCTADSIGTPTGGGLVTAQELQAFKEFATEQLQSYFNPTYSSVVVFSKENLGSTEQEPWKWDLIAHRKLQQLDVKQIKLAHFYSGTWPETVKLLKENGTKVVITIAAHDKELSRKEHEKLGWPFPYTHLTDPVLWQRYIEGYRLADVIVCPSTVARETVKNYGPDFVNKDIRVIPHGCFAVKEIKPIPNTFILGYLGSWGADKGIRYLLEAWRKLDYKDGSLLMLGGKDSTSPLATYLIKQYGGGNIHLAGWYENVSDFYNSISVYCQSSVTEGFGIEVLEAMAHERTPICSRNAGAQDVIPDEMELKFDACNVNQLANLINVLKVSKAYLYYGENMKKIAFKHLWFNVREQYKELWKQVV